MVGKPLQPSLESLTLAVLLHARAGRTFKLQGLSAARRTYVRALQADIRRVVAVNALVHANVIDGPPILLDIPAS